MKGDEVAALQMCARTRALIMNFSYFASKTSGFNAWRWHMVMGIPFVEFLISQKSTEGSAYEALRVSIPSFADLPRGRKEKACQRASMQVTDFQDVACCS